MQRKVYLAGPDVFLKDALEVLNRKRDLCASYRLDALIPLDNEVDASGPNAGQRICDANLEMIRSADLILANLSPFRGPHADPGTALEIGFANAIGLPVYGYSNDQRELKLRMKQDYPTPPNGQSYLIEDFQLHDNLMLEGILAQPLICANEPNDLSAYKAFETLLGRLQL